MKSLPDLKAEFTKLAGNPELSEMAFDAILARDFDVDDERRDMIIFMMARKTEGMGHDRLSINDKLLEIERIYKKMTDPARKKALPNDLDRLFTDCIHAVFSFEIRLLGLMRNNHNETRMTNTLNCATAPSPVLAPLYPPSLRNDLLDASAQVMQTLEKGNIAWTEKEFLVNSTRRIIAAAEKVPTANKPASEPALPPDIKARHPIQFKIVDQPGSPAS